MADFAKAFAYLQPLEGGYSDDPADRADARTEKLRSSIDDLVTTTHGICRYITEGQLDDLANRLVEGMALAGLLAQPGVTVPLSRKAKGMAIEYAAALRAELEGGEA